MKKLIRTLRFCFALAGACFSISHAFSAAGDLYNGGLADNVVYRFTPAAVRSTFANVTLADAVAFDRNGNLFVSNTQSNIVIKITPGGTQTTFATGIKTTGLAFDNAGNLYATDSLTSTVYKYAPSGARTVYASNLGGQPFGLALNRSGDLFVSVTNNTVVKVAANGTQSVFVPASAGLTNPQGLAVDNNGFLYVVNFSSGKISKFNAAAGQSTFATATTGLRHIAIDANGSVYVANFVTQQILKFAPTGGSGTLFAMSNAGGLAFEPATGILTSISTRAFVGTNSQVEIAGFIITGTDPKQILVRGIGPELALPPFNIQGTLQNPTVTLYRGQTVLVTNDNWQSAANASQIPVSLRPGDARESAILITLAPGAYTAIMQGVSATTGIGLVQVYDLATSALSQLTNLSTRGFVGTGDNVLIAGVEAAGGNGSTRVVIRALGPTLTNLGVAGALANPFLRVANANGATVAVNDNWMDTQKAALVATGYAPPNALESAVVLTLPAGRYTGIVSGVSNGTGVALVEAYKL